MLKRKHWLRVFCANHGNRPVGYQHGTTVLLGHHHHLLHQLVRRLEAEHPSVNFFWVFGADSVRTMHQWCDGDWLWGHINMLVIPREGFALTQMPAKATALVVSVPVISSTEVRELIKLGKPVDHLVPESVAEMVECLTY